MSEHQKVSDHDMLIEISAEVRGIRDDVHEVRGTVSQNTKKLTDIELTLAKAGITNGNNRRPNNDGVPLKWVAILVLVALLLGGGGVFTFHPEQARVVTESVKPLIPGGK